MGTIWELTKIVSIWITIGHIRSVPRRDSQAVQRKASPLEPSSQVLAHSRKNWIRKIQTTFGNKVSYHICEILPKECRPALLLWKGSCWGGLPLLVWRPAQLAHSWSSSLCTLAVVKTTRCLQLGLWLVSSQHQTSIDWSPISFLHCPSLSS